MNKKTYLSPLTMVVSLKTESLLDTASQLNAANSTQNIVLTETEHEGKFASRRFNVWDDEE